MKKRKSDTSSLGDAVGEMLESYGIQQKFDQAQLIASWENLMGKTIAKRTNKIFFKEKVLYVVLSSAPLKHQLILSKHKVIDQIHSFFGGKVIDDVVFM